ncbi:MAG: hypothetical protein VYD54_11460 [Bdellovibrionota bacterium]|nr:hypothetical protein [Bdellovibrionota bacterium]
MPTEDPENKKLKKKVKKKADFISFVVVLGWVFLCLVCLSINFIYKTPQPSILIFLLPIIFVLSINGFFLFKIEPLFFKFKTKGLDKYILSLLTINYLYSPITAIVHHDSVNGLFLIFCIILSNLFNCSVARTGAKKTLIVGLIHAAYIALLYLAYKRPFQEDDLLAFISLIFCTVFFALLNDIIRKQLAKIQDIKYDLDIQNMELDHYSIHIHNLLEKTKEHNKNLKRIVSEKTKEITDLLDHLRVAVFAVDEEFKVLEPISKHTEKIFKRNIIGETIYETLFPQIKKNSKEFEDIECSLPLFFGEDEYQFNVLEENLPKVVQLHDHFSNEEKVLKLSYNPIFDQNNLVEKFMCVVEDVTQSEDFFFKAKNVSINFELIKEIVTQNNKKTVCQILEGSIKNGLALFEIFVLSLDKVKEPSFFQKSLDGFFSKTRHSVRDLVLLDKTLNRVYWYVEKIEENENPSIEAISILSDGISSLLKYAENVNLFFPVDYHFNYNFTNRIPGLVKDLNQDLKILFEDILILNIDDIINDTKIENLAQNLSKESVLKRFGQISGKLKLTSSMLKSIHEDRICEIYEKLLSSFHNLFNEKTIEKKKINKYLVSSYKSFLEDTKDLESKITEKINLKKTQYIKDEDYIKMLINALNNINSDIISQSDLPESYFKNVKSVLTGIEQEISSKSSPKIEDSIYLIEDMIRNIFKSSLKESNALPVTKRNMGFLKFLEEHLGQKKAA